MIINPTKKSLPLFSTLIKTTDKNWGQAYSTVNPFFSWHANYYNVNRKKIVVLVNDLTFSSIVIADVNAQRKKELDALIREGIRVVLVNAGASKAQIQKYFELAGEMEVNAGFNRRVTGVTTMFVEELSYAGPIDFRFPLQEHLMAYLSQYGVSKLPHFHPVEELKAVLQQGFELKNVQESDFPKAKKKENPTVEVTWKDFKQLEMPDERVLSSYAFDKGMTAIIKNNELVMHAFEKYLREELGLSKKVVARHVSNTHYYIEFIATALLHTPISDFSDTVTFLSDFAPRKMWAEGAEIKRLGASLKKFFEFLQVAKVIDKKQLQEAKEEISMGLELGESELELSDSFFDLW